MQAGWPLYLNNNNYYTMGASCGGIAIVRQVNNGVPPFNFTSPPLR
jgi:hypothetical protein